MGAIGECNSGEIVANSVGVEDNCFTSLLNVSVTPNSINREIRCSDDIGAFSIPYAITETRGILDFYQNDIVSKSVNLHTDPFPPPKDVSVADVKQNQLAFVWSSSSRNCPALRYNILASNCGTCPSTTVETTATCEDLLLSSDAKQCTFSVQSVVCGDILSNQSDIVTVNLKGTV